MAKVLVGTEGKTDRLIIATAELTFRNLVGRYATASALPSPNDKGTIAELGAQLEKELYGIAVSSEDLFGILEEAIRLCEADYRNLISLAIKEMTERTTR